jgi:hypothetical protein
LKVQPSGTDKAPDHVGRAVRIPPFAIHLHALDRPASSAESFSYRCALKSSARASSFFAWTGRGTLCAPPSFPSQYLTVLPDLSMPYSSRSHS